MPLWEHSGFIHVEFQNGVPLEPTQKEGRGTQPIRLEALVYLYTNK
jgi:hypothetical protein